MSDHEVFNLSFAEARTWNDPPELADLNDEMRQAHFGAITFGAERVGPALYIFAMEPGSNYPDGEAHMHASDNWRIALKGSLPVGRKNYGPREFRFNAGWKAYPSDNGAQGPEGGWSAVFFADRRGTAVRPVSKTLTREQAEVFEGAAMVSNWAETGGDVVDLADTADESCLLTTLGALNNSGYLNGSFDDRTSWCQDAAGRAVAGALMGHPSMGPIVLLSHAPAGPIQLPDRTLDTEIVRMVVTGSCTIGDVTYREGGIRLQKAGVPSGPAVADRDGVSEVVILGDRRVVLDSLQDKGGWSPAAREVLEKLASELQLSGRA